MGKNASTRAGGLANKAYGTRQRLRQADHHSYRTGLPANGRDRSATSVPTVRIAKIPTAWRYEDGKPGGMAATSGNTCSETQRRRVSLLHRRHLLVWNDDGDLAAAPKARMQSRFGRAARAPDHRRQYLPQPEEHGAAGDRTGPWSDEEKQSQIQRWRDFQARHAAQVPAMLDKLKQTVISRTATSSRCWSRW